MLRQVWVVVFLFSMATVVSAQSSSSADNSAAGGPSKPLPPGPMQSKIKAACTQCHTADRITKQHMTRMEWNDQLDKMIGLGANVPDADRKAFLSYLTKNFGPEKGGKPKGGNDAK